MYMKFNYEVRGGHTHVHVFMHGAKCGDLCFRNEEFAEVRASNPIGIDYIDVDLPAPHCFNCNKPIMAVDAIEYQGRLYCADCMIFEKDVT
jgi:hypothetical protein